MNLLYLCLFFLFISPFYEQALKSMFRYNFKWHWASVVGIGIVMTCLAWFVWRPLGAALTWEFVWSSSALVFTCALWAMIRHGEWLLKEQIDTRQMLQKERTEKLESLAENERLRTERDNLKDEILPVLQRMENKQNDEARILAELTGILNMRLWAKNKIKEMDN